MPALPTSIGAAGASASRRPVPRTTTASLEHLHQRPQRRPPPAAWSRCRRRAGSPRCGPARRTSRRAAPRDGRSTCRPARAIEPDRPSAGSKRMRGGAARMLRWRSRPRHREAEAGDQLLRAPGSLVARDPQRDHALAVVLRGGQRHVGDVDAGASELERELARSRRAGSAPRRAARARARRRAAPRAAPARSAPARSFHAPSAARRRRASHVADLLQARHRARRCSAASASRLDM